MLRRMSAFTRCVDERPLKVKPEYTRHGKRLIHARCKLAQLRAMNALENTLVFFLPAASGILTNTGQSHSSEEHASGVTSLTNSQAAIA